jgi:ubiquinone/menaquinone biosynthesis C-methylase UbiE
MNADADHHPVARQYDRWASVYDWLWRHYIDQTLPVLEVGATIQPGEQVLDVGCGTGAFEERLLADEAPPTIVGIDLSARMLRRARTKLADAPQVTFQQADVHDLPFADARFDVVVSASTFHYFDDPDRALAEMARVLRPGGRLVILDWCQDFWMCRAMDAVLGVTDPAYQRCFFLDEMRAFVQRSPLSWKTGRRLRVGWVWGMMLVEARAD